MSGIPSFTLQLLHVRCGFAADAEVTPYFASDIWEENRFDIVAEADPENPASLAKLERINDDAMDAVYCTGTLEFLYPHQVPQLLASFHRVLKETGQLVITCPDLQTICSHIAQGRLMEKFSVGPEEKRSAFELLFGLGSSLQTATNYVAQHCGFIHSLMTNELHRAGFSHVWCLRQTAYARLVAVASCTTVTEESLRELAKKHFPPEKPKLLQ